MSTTRYHALADMPGVFTPSGGEYGDRVMQTSCVLTTAIPNPDGPILLRDE